MKKTLLLFTALSLCFCFAVKAQTASKAIDYPKDFILPETEILKGYILKPIDEETRSVGFAANPGYIENPSFVLGLYENMEQQAVEKVFVAMYQLKGDPDFETGYYAIAFKSEAWLNKEKTKFRKYNGARYFTSGRYLLQVWGDAGSFADMVAHVSEYFKTKLDLKEFTPKKQDDTESTKAAH